MKRLSPLLCTVLTSTVLFSLAGCGASNGVTPVRGTVTYNNKPVTAGTIQFISVDGHREACGSLLGDGSFKIPDVPLGTVKVVIKTEPFKNLKGPTKPDPRLAPRDAPYSGGAPVDGPGMVYVPIPAKYEKLDTTDLHYEIDRSTDRIDIVLR